MKTEKTSKVLLIILTVIFVVVNVISGILIISFQINEDTVVDSIPDSVTSYVDFDALFEKSPDDDYYHEQTTFYKVNTKIPVNYKVEQSDSNNSVQTQCVQITDDDLLSNYYKEMQERYTVYGINNFSSDLSSLKADKGFYYIVDNSSVGIVVVKGDKLFNIYIDEKSQMDNSIMQQIATL